MGLGSSAKFRKNVQHRSGGGGRSAEDYGIPNLSDATLQQLAGNAKLYGEKSGLARLELGQRQGVTSDANAYRAALERATYQDAGNQYGQGLTGISQYLARSGPLADSGAATALRARLASQIYGAAAGRISGGYAGYLGNIMNQRRAFNYQKQLLAYQKRLGKRSALSQVAGIAGGIGGALIGGPPGAVAGYGIGSSIGGLPQGDYPLGGYPAGSGFPTSGGYYG